MIRTIPSLLFFALATGSLAGAQNFSYTDFTNAAGLALNGNAAIAGTALQVTSNLGSQTSSAYYDQPVSVIGGFETTFFFQFTNPTCGGADGMTFIIQADPRGTTALGSTLGGSYLAYSDPAGALAIANSLVIELDTWQADADLSGNEVSVHTNGTADNSHDEAFSIGSVDPSPLDLSDPLGHTAMIRYQPGLLEVFIDDMITPVLSTPYDFSSGGVWLGGGVVGGLNLINGTSAYVGFTGATGGCTETHDVLSWDFASGGGLGTQYCPGDGVLPHTLCPCANNNDGSMGGCDWGDPAFPGGGVLTASGTASMGANDAFLNASNIEDNFGIFFGANNQVNSGNGNPLNDGLRCAGGGLVRLIPPTMASGNQAVLPLPIQTLDIAAAAGVTRRYQYWFRTPGGPCGQMANLTNGLEIDWLP